MGHNCCGNTNIHGNTGRGSIERNTWMYCIEQYVGGGCVEWRLLPIKHVGGQLSIPMFWYYTELAPTERHNHHADSIRTELNLSVVQKLH
jgi:hypothetical protein